MKIDFVPFSKLNNIEKILDTCESVGGIGVFDGVHLGHQRLLKNIVEVAKRYGYESTIITFYPPTRFLFNKTKYILTTNLEKIELFERFGIERVIIFEFNESLSMLSPIDFLKVLESLNIKHLFVGRDFRFGYKRKGDLVLMKTVLKEKGIEVEGVDIVSSNGKKISSTEIKNLILKGNIKEANNYLGYSFFMRGLIFKDMLIPHINKVRPKDGSYKIVLNHNEIKDAEVVDGKVFIHDLKSYELSNKVMRISFLK